MSLMLVKEKRGSKVGERNNTAHTEEVIAFCPGCKALQTVWLNGNTLMPTSKFTQEGNHIYHNCGERQPCRLYFSG
jgi:hypothetical protein